MLRSLLLLVLLAACRPAAAPPEVTPPPEERPADGDARSVAPLRWSWGPAGSVGVSYTIDRDGDLLRGQATMTWAPDGGGQTVVGSRDASFDREDLSERWREQLWLLDALVGFDVPIIVDAKGFATGAADVSPMLEAAAAAMDDLDPKKLAAMRAMATGEHMKASLTALAMDDWRLAVEDWIGLALSEGGSLSRVVEGATTSGAMVTSAVVYEHLGTDPAHPGSIHLRKTTTPTDESSTGAAAASVQELVASYGITPEQAAAWTAGLRTEAQTVAEAVLDPTTLKPWWTRRTKSVAVHGGPEPLVSRRVTETHYAW